MSVHYHIARVGRRMVRTVFASLEYPVDDPPEKVFIDGVEWTRTDLLGNQNEQIPTGDKKTATASHIQARRAKK